MLRSRRTARLRILLAGLCLVGMGAAARADIVRLQVGPRAFGQGWMFLDFDGRCKVVTAAHVVRGLDGRVVLPVVLDERGRQMPAGAPLVVSDKADIAVLPVPSADGPALCGAGRLSAVGVERRVREMAQASISTTGGSEVREIPVLHRASHMDSNGGEMFAVRPTLGTDLVAKGWSGSVVRDGEGPLGIVVQVDPESNEALAVRIDVVRRLMEAAPAAPPVGPAAAGGARPPALMVLAGKTADPAEGPDQVSGPGPASWRVEPVQRTVVFTATFATPVQIRQVTLGTAAGSQNRIEAMDVATQAAGGNEEEWTGANYCRTPADATALACAFLVRTVVRVRLVVKTRTGDPILLTGFTAN